MKKEKAEPQGSAFLNSYSFYFICSEQFRKNILKRYFEFQQPYLDSHGQYYYL